MRMAVIDLTASTPRSRTPFQVRYRMDGRDFRIQFQWNARANNEQGAWFMGVFDSTGAPLIAAVKLVNGTDLLRKYKYLPAIPQGNFDVIRSDGLDINARLGDLNTTVTVQYVEVATLLAESESE